MLVAGEIRQKPLRKFREFFFVSPFNSPKCTYMCPATTYIVLVELRDVCQVINQSQVVGHRLVCLLLFDLQLILPGVPVQPLLPLGVPCPEQAHYHLVIRLVNM